MTVTSLKYIKFLPLSAAILLLPTLGFAEDYVIDSAATSTNDGAILADGDSITVTAGGSVTTTGSTAYGLNDAGADYVTLINRGTITTDGYYASGILATGDYATVTNSGTILTPGNTWAIYLGGSYATLNLNAGSVVKGLTDEELWISDAATATLNFGAGLNMVIVSDSSNLGSVTVTAPNGAWLRVDDTFFVVDITGFAAVDMAAVAADGLVLEALAGRSASAVQVTQGAIGAGHSWAQVYGGGLSAQGTALTSGYAAYGGGFVLGRERASGNGFFGGLSLGRTVGTAFSTDRTGVFAGFYRGLNIGAAGSEYSVTVGVNGNGSAREVSAAGTIQIAAATYASYNLSAAATFEGALGFDNSSARLRYLGIYSGGYTEIGAIAGTSSGATGLTGNLTVAGRMTHVAEVRLQMKSAGLGPGTLRYGVDGQYISAGATETILAGSDLSFENAHGGFAGRGFVGYDFDTSFANGLTGTGSVELAIGSTGTTSAQASFRVLF